MIIDAYKLPKGKTLNCDICIVGAGAAGITVASELNNTNLNVILLESGGLTFESATQDLYRGTVCSAKHHASLDQYRERRFGGTTTVWGGRGAPFDDIDFEERPHVPNSGWPIDKNELVPYYKRAHEYLDLGNYTYSVSEALGNAVAELIPGLSSEEVDMDKLWLYSLPTDMGKTYLNELKISENINVYLHANCLNICVDQNGKRVENLKVSSLANNEFEVRANHYVLASGGLEVTRLLLNSNDVHTKGLGNSSGNLGRFYMSHVGGTYGEIVLRPEVSGNVVSDYEKTFEGVYSRRCITFREHAQRSHGLLNFRAILDHPSPHDPSHKNGVLSAMYLAKTFLARRIPPEYSKQLSDMSRYQQVFGHFKNIVFDSPELLLFTQMWIRKRILAKRKLPSVIANSRSNKYTIHYDAEQSPNPESRVFLSGEKDSFGLRRLKVDWRYSRIDIENICKSYELLKNALESSAIGTIEADFELLPEIVKEKLGVGSHHIGTTRMSDNPNSGVVDKNCMVHEVPNLYIASSSVFPTASCVNPTLTIVALAVRLADHLKQSDYSN